MKVVFVTKHPAPYRDRTLEEFSRFSEIELKVYNIQQNSDNHKEWKYDGNNLNQYLKRPIKVPVLGDYNTDIISKIRDADVLVVGSYYPTTNLVTLLYALKHKIPYVVCSDAVNSGRKFRFAKSIIVNRIWNNARAFWVPGNMSKQYFISQGIPEKKIYCGYYVNDAKEMLTLIQENNGDNLRCKYGLKNKKVFLFVGKLIHSRHIENLTQAVLILEKKGYDFKVIIIGSGPDKSIVEAAVNKSHSIVSIDSVPYNELHQYYGIADAYVHPGEEPYSLATVEGVVAGVPIIATKKVGCVCDYLQDEKNGFVFDGTPEDLALKMEKVILNEVDSEEVKKMQEFLINERSIQWAAKELLCAVSREE